MRALLSAAVGAVIGALNSSLALGPFSRSPIGLTVRGAVGRLIARLVAVTAILVACIAAGADARVLLTAVAAGFTVQTVRILRRTVT